MMPEWEFRLTKIENLLMVLTERQVEQQVEITLLQESQNRTDGQIHVTSQQIERTDRQLQRTDHQIQITQKQVDALAHAIERLNDSQERTEARLQALINKVARLYGN